MKALLCWMVALALLGLAALWVNHSGLLVPAGLALMNLGLLAMAFRKSC